MSNAQVLKTAVRGFLLLLALNCYSFAQATQCTADTSAPSVSLISGLTTTSYIDTTVTDGTVYGYVVTAVDMAGSTCSNVIANATIPSTGTHTVTLSWTASTTVGVTYSVFRAPTPAAVVLTVVVN
jgi:hypothetical protein